MDRYSYSLAKINGIHSPGWEWPCWTSQLHVFRTCPAYNIELFGAPRLSCSLRKKHCTFAKKSLLQLEKSFPFYSMTHPSIQSHSNSILWKPSMMTPTTAPILTGHIKPSWYYSLDILHVLSLYYLFSLFLLYPSEGRDHDFHIDITLAQSKHCSYLWSTEIVLFSTDKKKPLQTIK